MRSFAGLPGRGSLLVAALLLAASPAAAQTAGGGRDTGFFDRERDAAPEPRRDVLIGSSGYHRGELQGCSAQGCAFDGTTYPRAAIVFLGLGVAESEAPPAIEDYTSDSVHLRGAPAVQARLLGINADSVVTERGSFPREAVAWIFLAPAAPAPDEGPGGYGAPPPASPPPPVVQPPEPPTDSAGAAPPGFAPPGSQGERGALWTGTIHATYTTYDAQYTNVYTIAIDPVRLRERHRPIFALDGRQAGVHTLLVPEGSVLGETHSVSGDCVGGGRGSVVLDGPEEAGMIWRKTVDVDTAPFLGFEVPSGPGIYILYFHPPIALTSTLICAGAPATSIDLHFTFPVNIGRIPLPQPDGGDPEVRALDGGRMVGSYRSIVAEPDEVTVSWSICREGVGCPPAPPPSLPDEVAASPPPTDDCPGPDPQQALLELALDQQKLLSDKLIAQRQAYDVLAQQAAAWKGDFEHASRDCSLWSAALTLASFLAGRGPVRPTAGGYVYNPGEAFANLLNLIDKVAVGDPSWMLPDIESDSLPSVETAWDAFRAGYDALGPASPEKLLNDLRNCGAPTYQGVMDGAVTYLRLMQQIEPMMREIRTTLNDLRQKDLELLDKWHAYHRACLEHARCEGRDPAMCAVPPRRQ